MMSVEGFETKVMSKNEAREVKTDKRMTTRRWKSERRGRKEGKVRVKGQGHEYIV
jgi:hypothetical protein